MKKIFLKSLIVISITTSNSFACSCDAAVILFYNYFKSRIGDYVNAQKEAVKKLTEFIKEEIIKQEGEEIEAVANDLRNYSLGFNNIFETRKFEEDTANLLALDIDNNIIESGEISANIKNMLIEDKKTLINKIDSMLKEGAVKKITNSR